MPTREPSTSEPSVLVAFSLLAAFLFLPAVLMQIPRTNTRADMPYVWVSPKQAEWVAARDERLRGGIKGNPAAAQLAKLIRQVGKAEVLRRTRRDIVEARTKEIITLTQSLVESGSLGALRSDFASVFHKALTADAPSMERVEVLGRFPSELERYGVLREGKLIAPLFIATTLYKARWNAICARPLTEGFTAVETRSYRGWLAMHAEAAPPPARAAAARALGNLTALGELALMNKEPEQAASLFFEAYGQTGLIRHRNRGLALSATNP